ncbi:hypothetical protein RIR_jg29121.t1 [Rhizophagus irregularis DAOM 181602=DAOM 197198]|nr:hypothetical protein RIR_jg29121.t1 [Rhizophagus irregularis DAOM 181602=DAOM 197198]
MTQGDPGRHGNSYLTKFGWIILKFFFFKVETIIAKIERDRNTKKKRKGYIYFFGGKKPFRLHVIKVLPLNNPNKRNYYNLILYIGVY